MVDWIFFNVVYIHHRTLRSHRKKLDHVLCRDMDGAGGHYPQQMNAGIENQILCVHVLTSKWELKDENTWTHRGEQTDTGASGRVEGGRRKSIRKNN